jgi:hypothetical protein
LLVAVLNVEEGRLPIYDREGVVDEAEEAEQEGKVVDDPWQKGAFSSSLFVRFLPGSILARPLVYLLSRKPGIRGMLAFRTGKN